MGGKFRNKMNIEEASIKPDHYGKGREKYKGKIPEKCIIFYQDLPFDYLMERFQVVENIDPQNLEKGQCEKLDMSHGLGFQSKGVYCTEDFLFSKLSIGAPNATMMLEEMIVLGVKEFISMGRAGGLKNYGFFLCEKALIEEGTSRHYVLNDPFDTYAYPDKELTDRLGEFFTRNDIEYERAANWTIDIPFGETKPKIEAYREQGIATVDMEASALFTVAGIREAKIASAFLASDVFSEGGWEGKGRRDKESVKKDLKKLTDAVVDCFSERTS